MAQLWAAAPSYYVQVLEVMPGSSVCCWVLRSPVSLPTSCCLVLLSFLSQVPGPRSMVDRFHLGTLPHISTFALQWTLPSLSFFGLWSQHLSQLPPSFPVSTLVVIQLPASWLTFPLLAFALANTAVGRCPGSATKEHRRLLENGETKGWHTAKCHCKKIPHGECGGLERPRPQGSGVAFSVPCWLNCVRSPSWPHLSIPVELPLC